jgi:hypothetical protein
VIETFMRNDRETQTLSCCNFPARISASLHIKLSANAPLHCCCQRLHLQRLLPFVKPFDTFEMNALQLLRFVVLVGLTLAITSADTKLVETDRQLAITIACPQGEGLQNAFYIMTIDLTADDTVCSIEELADMETDFSIALDQYVTGAVKSVPAVTFENNNICSVDGEASAVRLLMMESFQDAFHRRLGFVYRFVGSGKCRYVNYVAKGILNILLLCSNSPLELSSEQILRTRQW